MDLRLVHLVATKHVLRYLKRVVDYGLKYEVNQMTDLEGYVDSNWVGNSIDRKSTLGSCFSMRSGVISWFSRKQSCVALSTNMEKYVATCSTTCGKGAAKLQYVIQIKISRKREF